MNVLSKRNSVHLRMTNVQFVHVHFLTPTPGQRSFRLVHFVQFISFSSFRSFRSVHFVLFISFISFIFSRRLRWYDCGSIKVAFCTIFYFLDYHITYPLDVFLIIQLSSFSSRLNLPFVHSVHQPFGNLSAFIQFVHCGSLKIFPFSSFSSRSYSSFMNLSFPDFSHKIYTIYVNSF